MKLETVIPITAGIFQQMKNNGYSAPWDDIISPENMDVEYIGNISGFKPVSPLVFKMLEDGSLSDDNKAKLSSIIVGMYSKKWQKLYDTMSFDYDPISNYNMTETEEEIGNKDTIGNKTNTGNNSDNRTVDLTDTTNHGRTNTDRIEGSSGIYGFNSDASVTTDDENRSIESTEGGTTTEMHSGTDNVSHSINETEETSGNEKSNVNRTLTRKGNIGVTTSQQMIESERELWNWRFFEIVFDDVDRVLTLPIY